MYDSKLELCSVGGRSPEYHITGKGGGFVAEEDCEGR